MGSFEFKGFDEMTNRLQEMGNTVDRLNGAEVDLNELFCSEFLKDHSDYSSFSELLHAGGFVVSNQEDFDAIDVDALDAHIASTTDYDSWEDFKSAAAVRYVSDQLDW